MTPSADDVVVSTSRHAPHAGRVFIGVYALVPRPAEAQVSGVTCDAKLGGHLRTEGGNVVFVGGVRLRPIITRVYADPDAQGNRYLARATCGWRVPRGSAGKLLSLAPPPSRAGCDFSCAAWGFDIHGPAFDTMVTQKTWRVRR